MVTGFGNDPDLRDCGFIVRVGKEAAPGFVRSIGNVRTQGADIGILGQCVSAHGNPLAATSANTQAHANSSNRNEWPDARHHLLNTSRQIMKHACGSYRHFNFALVNARTAPTPQFPLTTIQITSLWLEPTSRYRCRPKHQALFFKRGDSLILEEKETESVAGNADAAGWMSWMPARARTSVLAEKISSGRSSPRDAQQSRRFNA
jgi:hypothetical protein